MILSYDLNSDIKTAFQIFYKKESKPEYNGTNSYKVAIKKGDNKINLIIPSVYVNNNLRLDLVSNIGNYYLRKFKLYDAE